jgi:hypothetical protein
MSHSNLGKAANSLLTASEVNRCLSDDGSGNFGVGTETPQAEFDVSQATFIYSITGEEYQRSACWSRTAANTISSPKGMVVVNDKAFLMSVTAYALNTAGNWDSAETTYATPANRVGKDFYVYACDNSGILDIVLSALSTYPADYTAATSRKIGGFHCLCANVGSISGHDLTGYAAGDILPLSVWDLLHRANSENEGMVWDERARIWVDIYLSNSTYESKYNNAVKHSTNWMDFVDGLGALNKRLLEDDEFSIIAAGSNEETEISTEARDPTGGNSDHDGVDSPRRMISDIGCEDCCGLVWQWLRTQSYRGSLDGAAFDDEYTYKDETDGKGQLYTQGDYGDVKLLAGGNWNDAASCGSRSRNAYSYRWNTTTSLGARGCAEPRVVNL